MANERFDRPGALRRCAVLAVVLAAGLGTAAYGQATGPGQLERQFTTPPALPSGEGPVVPQTPGQQPPADAGSVRFTLKQVDFAGNTAYSAQALAAPSAALIGREVSLADVFRLADELTLMYRNDGYVLSRVIVPPQAIRDGVVQLRVVEGFIAQTSIRGESSGPRSTLDRHLEVIRNSRPLAAGILERELLLMNDLPGINALSTIVPSATPGAADLAVEIASRRASLTAGINNRGSKSLGPWRADLSGELNQLLYGFDRLSARLVQTLADRELSFATLGYDRVLGASGARIGLSGSYVDSRPGTNQNFQLPTSSRSLTLQGSVPLLRSRTQNLNLRASLSKLHSKTDVVAAGTALPLSEDNISALRLGATVDLVDRFRGLSVVDVELSKGLHAFSASRAGDANLSVADGRPDFTKLTVYAARLQSLATKWSLLGAINAQYSRHVLLSPERFAFGGEQFGRAYDTAELTGDSGAAFKSELRYADSAASPWLRDYTLYGFYEVGTLRRRGASVAAGGQKARESAANAGVGVRVSMSGGWSGYAEVAQPLTHDVAQEGNRSARAFVGVQGAF